MKLIPSALALALAAFATTANAHAAHLPHVHGSDAVFWGAALVLAAGVAAAFRAKADAIPLLRRARGKDQ
ncbi:MAG: hypothetical protein AAFR73_00390 [Pseudomonadota bacterium]